MDEDTTQGPDASLSLPSPLDIRRTLKESGVTREEAAGMVHVSYRTWHSWSAPEGTNNHRQMPLAAWELLLLKLGKHPTKKLVDN